MVLKTKFCPFLSLTTINGQQNFLSLGGRLLDSFFETKIGFDFFFYNVENFFNFAFFSLFFYDFLINMARKLEIV